MSRLQAALERIVADLNDIGRQFALIGGLAVSARAEPRFTRDIDLAVAVESDDDAEDLVRELHARSWRVAHVLEQEATGRLAQVALEGPVPDEPVRVDLLFASSGIEREIVESAEALDVLPDVVVRVASIGHLIALKVLAQDDARRPQDRADAIALLQCSAEDDLETARDAMRLIETRGYHRNRDLADLFEPLIEQVRGDS